MRATRMRGSSRRRSGDSSLYPSPSQMLHRWCWIAGGHRVGPFVHPPRWEGQDANDTLPLAYSSAPAGVRPLPVVFPLGVILPRQGGGAAGSGQKKSRPETSCHWPASSTRARKIFYDCDLNPSNRKATGASIFWPLARLTEPLMQAGCQTEAAAAPPGLFCENSAAAAAIGAYASGRFGPGAFDFRKGCCINQQLDFARGIRLQASQSALLDFAIADLGSSSILTSVGPTPVDAELQRTRAHGADLEPLPILSRQPRGALRREGCAGRCRGNGW